MTAPIIRTCEAFFVATAGDDTNRSRDLAEQPVENILAWEQQCAVPTSPGPVDNDESLLRAFNQPTHWDREGKTLTPTAFEEAERFGLSVNRLRHASIAHIAGLAEQRVRDFNARNIEPTRSRCLIGFADFAADQIRKLVSEPDQQCNSSRLLAVFDTAYPDDASHADIFIIVKCKAMRRRARGLLRELGLANLRDSSGNPVTCEQIAAILRFAGVVGSN